MEPVKVSLKKYQHFLSCGLVIGFGLLHGVARGDEPSAQVPLQDITFKNVSINSDKGVSVTNAQGISFADVSVVCKTGDKLKTTRVKNSRLDIQD
jgi:hypothetical protein